MCSNTYRVSVCTRHVVMRSIDNSLAELPYLAIELNYRLATQLVRVEEPQPIADDLASGSVTPTVQLIDRPQVQS